MKLAGAPISWGVCEVPGWGYQLSAERVLREMRSAGLQATEFGPEGYLAVTDLRAAGIAAVGAFAPVLLHDAEHDPVPTVAAVLDRLVAAGAPVLVLAASTGTDGYDTRPELDALGWKTLLHNLDQLGSVAADRGVTAVLHPHVGTMIERRAEVDRVLDGSALPLCLDTGHLSIGGTEPLELVNRAASRIGHVHLKDVDALLAARVRGGVLTYTDAVRLGMYRPLGAGDADIADVVTELEFAGYDGWFVLEQDTILDADPAGRGPLTDVEESIAYLRSSCASVSSSSPPAIS